MRPSRRLLVWSGLAAVAVALLVIGLGGRGANAGRTAPALPRARLAGSPVTLAALLGQASGAHAGGAPPAGGSSDRAADATGAHAAHPALVLFWASWCSPCQHEAPAVERFALSTAGRGRIVGIDYGESAGAGPRTFLRRYRWSFPNLSDPDARAGEAYGLTVLPSTFVIDAHGRIRATLRGPQTEQSLAHALAAAAS